MLINICPVCGYGLSYRPADYHICPCCGTEFGYDDVGTSVEELRQRWVAGGANWWSPVDPKPHRWNPFLQMALTVIPTSYDVSLPVANTSSVPKSYRRKTKKRRARGAYSVGDDGRLNSLVQSQQISISPGVAA